MRIGFPSTSFLFLFLLSLRVNGGTLERNRVRKDVASTLAVDSLGTPILTTGLDALGGTQVGTGMGLGAGGLRLGMGTGGLGLGMGTGGLGLGLGAGGLGTGGLGLGAGGLVDTSGLQTGGLGITATSGEAVGDYYTLSSLYTFVPVDTSTSMYILPSNLQAFIPDQLFLAQSPPLSPNYILACDLDLYGTSSMCYYYYFN